MHLVSEIQDFEGKKVVVRTDWNVPHDRHKILDTSRIDVTLETIRYISSRGGIVVVISHFGREGESMMDLANLLAEILPVEFIADPFSEEGRARLTNLKVGGVALVENLRKWQGEEENTEQFAKDLASLGEIYVNEAFSASHRSHASIVSVPKILPSFAGFHFMKEVTNLSRAFNPEHPFLFILGGAKLETKIPLVKEFLSVADNIFIGGALAKPAKATELGDNPKIIFPLGELDALDAGEETLEMLRGKINSARFILWNGPLGKYEDGYDKGTKTLALMIALSNAEKIVGGGDTEEVIDVLNIKDKFSWVSLAGGAMLDFLAKRTLPGIEALNRT